MPSVKQFNYDIAYALDYLIYTMNIYNSGERSNGQVLLFVHIITTFLILVLGVINESEIRNSTCDTRYLLRTVTLNILKRSKTIIV